MPVEHELEVHSWPSLPSATSQPSPASVKHPKRPSLRRWVRRAVQVPSPLSVIDPVASRGPLPVYQTDDYLTAHHANPWTGNISPSVRSIVRSTDLPTALDPRVCRMCAKSFVHEPSMVDSERAMTSDRFAILTPTLEPKSPPTRLAREDLKSTPTTRPSAAQIAALRHYQVKSQRLSQHEYGKQNATQMPQFRNEEAERTANTLEVPRPAPVELSAQPPSPGPEPHDGAAHSSSPRPHFYTGPIVSPSDSIRRKPVATTGRQSFLSGLLRGRGARVRPRVASSTTRSPMVNKPKTDATNAKCDAILAASLGPLQAGQSQPKLETPKTVVKSTPDTARPSRWTLRRSSKVPTFVLPPPQTRCAGTFKVEDAQLAASNPAKAQATAGRLALRRPRAHILTRLRSPARPVAPRSKPFWLFMKVDMRALGRLFLLVWGVIFAFLALRGVGQAIWITLMPLRIVARILWGILGPR